MSVSERGEPTVFAGDRFKTDKTEETLGISNVDFLTAIFGAENLKGRPILSSLPRLVETKDRKLPIERPWTGRDDRAVNETVGSKNYFSLSTFVADASGRYRRSRELFGALHAISLDGIDSKSLVSEIPLLPSWALSLSEDNHHVGYILCEPITDYLAANNLTNAITRLGLRDQNVSDLCSHLAQLPTSCSGCCSDPDAVQLSVWEPCRRYSTADLIGAFGLTPDGAQSSSSESDLLRQQAPSDSSPIFIHAPRENSVIQVLKDKKFYIRKLANGRHRVLCPWKNHHQGSQEPAQYTEPEDLLPVGTYTCGDPRCEARDISHLLRYIGVDGKAARMKPTIRLIPGEIHRIADAAERELAKTEQFFERGDQIVSVGCELKGRPIQIQPVTASELVRILSRLAIWEKFDVRSKSWRRTDPPARQTNTLLGLTKYRHLKTLNGLAEQPYMRPDASFVKTSGFDPETGILGTFKNSEFSVPQHPNLADAKQALDVVSGLLSEFEFASETDRVATLCAFLTASIRGSLPRAPMFHVTAHISGSGKSYLCELITAFASARRSSPTAFPGEDEECRKLLLAELMSAPPTIEFDNLTSNLIAHKSLCTALTSEHISGRILGASQVVTVPTRTLFLSSGNNVRPVEDMTRRCLTIRLDPKCEVPSSRRFNRPHLVSEVLKERGKYVSAALTIIGAWLEAGRPISACRPFVGFSEWSNLCCQPLMWLGAIDPVASVFHLINDDPSRQLLRQFVTVWRASFGSSATKVRDLVRYSDGTDTTNIELRNILDEIAGESTDINRKKLGRWIERHKGQVVDGYRIVRVNDSQSAASWYLEPVS